MYQHIKHTAGIGLAFLAGMGLLAVVVLVQVSKLEEGDSAPIAKPEVKERIVYLDAYSARGSQPYYNLFHQMSFDVPSGYIVTYGVDENGDLKLAGPWTEKFSVAFDKGLLFEGEVNTLSFHTSTYKTLDEWKQMFVADHAEEGEFEGPVDYEVDGRPAVMFTDPGGGNIGQRYRHVAIESEDGRVLEISQGMEEAVFDDILASMRFGFDAIEGSYFDSPFRVLHVIRNTEADYFVTVATTRNADGNDTQCGSLYTSPTCYFILERDYSVNSPEPRLIAMQRRAGALDMESLRFIDEDTLEYKTADGDGGWGFTATWHLRVSTGEITEVSRQEFNAE